MNYYNYFSEIEEFFVRKRGKNLLLNPLDWALIETWKEQGIPLRIVLQGIEAVFDATHSNPKRRPNIRSLSYCKAEVEKSYVNWREAQVGGNSGERKSGKSSETDDRTDSQKLLLDSHLDQIIANLRGAIVGKSGELKIALEQAVEMLEKESVAEPEKLEERLETIESSIENALTRSFDPSSLDEIKSEVALSLLEHRKTMNREVYARTFNLMLMKKLRESADIPRLSLLI